MSLICLKLHVLSRTQSHRRRPPRGGKYDEDADGSGSLSEMFSELSRIPALIETIGRDQLVFHVPDDDSGFLQQQAIRQSGPTAALSFGRGEWGSSNKTELQTPFPSHSEPPSSFDDEDIASSFEVVVHMPRRQVASGSTGAAGGRTAALVGSVSSETLDILADQVAQSVVSHSSDRVTAVAFS